MKKTIVEPALYLLYYGNHLLLFYIFFGLIFTAALSFSELQSLLRMLRRFRIGMPKVL